MLLMLRASLRDCQFNVRVFSAAMILLTPKDSLKFQITMDSTNSKSQLCIRKTLLRTIQLYLSNHLHTTMSPLSRKVNSLVISNSLLNRISGRTNLKIWVVWIRKYLKPTLREISLNWTLEATFYLIKFSLERWLKTKKSVSGSSPHSAI